MSSLLKKGKDNSLPQCNRQKLLAQYSWVMKSPIIIHIVRPDLEWPERELPGATNNRFFPQKQEARAIKEFRTGFEVSQTQFYLHTYADCLCNFDFKHFIWTLKLGSPKLYIHLESSLLVCRWIKCDLLHNLVSWCCFMCLSATHMKHSFLQHWVQWKKRYSQNDFTETFSNSVNNKYLCKTA